MIQDTDDSQDLSRAAAAGAMLACFFEACVQAAAAGKPWPDLDEVIDDAGERGDPDVVSNAFSFIAATLGIQDVRGRLRVVRLFTAMAEMLAERGADLENLMSDTVHDDPHHALIVRMKTVRE